MILSADCFADEALLAELEEACQREPGNAVTVTTQQGERELRWVMEPFDETTVEEEDGENRSDASISERFD